MEIVRLPTNRRDALLCFRALFNRSVLPCRIHSVHCPSCLVALFVRMSAWTRVWRESVLVTRWIRVNVSVERRVVGPSFRKYRTGSCLTRSLPPSPCSPCPVGPGELYFGDGILPPVLSDALPNFGNDWWLLRTGPNLFHLHARRTLFAAYSIFAIAIKAKIVHRVKHQGWTNVSLAPARNNAPKVSCEDKIFLLIYICRLPTNILRR